MRERLKYLRIALLCVYLSLIAVVIYYEYNSFRIFQKAKELEDDQKYQTAGMAYQVLIEKNSFSITSAYAKRGIERIRPALSLDPTVNRLSTTKVENIFGKRFGPYLIDYLPFFAFPLCIIILLSMILMNLRRLKLVAVLLVWLIFACLVFTLQLNYYGFIQSSDMKELSLLVVDRPMRLYVSSWSTLLITAYLSLRASKARE